jgi:hypothetical protein
MGSLTISAWINSSSFPVDDAAIVSSLDPGFQLDTTVDTGPRTIGFKLVDPCGEVVARYGATELTRNTWYHVAGVYDGQAEDVAKLVHHGGQQVESADGLRVGRRRELAPRDARGITHPPDETVAVQCR